MTSLHIADPVERDDLAAFTARVVRLDQTAQVRLLAHAGRITAWAATPFDVLAIRSVRGEGAGMGRHVTVKVPLRCLFALSGMGFLGAGVDGETDTDVVRISATGSWLRLDARFGAVVRRRITTLPLVVT